jgi:hypothetical protein
MGVVPKQMVDNFSYHGDVCLTYAVYIYCDNCGSFDIEKVLSIRQWLLMIGGCSLGAIGISIRYAPVSFITIPDQLANRYWLIMLFGFLLIGMLVYGFWGFSDYRCRKCGEFTTIRYNTRDYPWDIKMDVPEQLAQKYGLRGWPGDQSIKGYLRPPENHKEKE